MNREIWPAEEKIPAGSKVRKGIRIEGLVQGVGFRPFIYRLAIKIGLTGWVGNSPRGVALEAEGTEEQVERFLQRLFEEKPRNARVQIVEKVDLPPVYDSAFEIRPSDPEGKRTAQISPDLGSCPECVKEVFDPGNRRYRYPFTNCTRCGPRFSIVESLPYDRSRTSMKIFSLCNPCRSEFENPLDRRFHAQPNACPECGPRLALCDPDGKILSARHDALLGAAGAIRRGEIVAVKGLGGFHLMADARNEDAVARLRRTKKRGEKPFALMFPSLEIIKKTCLVSELEERLLLSLESPIVLLRRRVFTDSPCLGDPASAVAASVSPGNPFLGIMLPYMPLHHLLMAELGIPLIATSGNLADEPICIDESEAFSRLNGLADLFLIHDRPIVRPVDDSIVKVIHGRELLIRRSRGYAPLSFPLEETFAPLLAAGGHQKNTIALVSGSHVFVSQHLGDLESFPAVENFQRTVDSFQRIYQLQPERVSCDLHPGYRSTAAALRMLRPVSRVQHHHAHVVSCMVENGIGGSVLGIAWDGTGYGPDGTLWGGEFLLATRAGFERAAHFRTFSLPGGEKAVREPRRTALGLLYEIYGEGAFELTGLPPLQAFLKTELRSLRQMFKRRMNTPVTSSAGRLFDGIASLAGLRQRVNFEGQAATEMEFAIDESVPEGAYSVEITRQGTRFERIVDWEPVIRGVLEDLRQGVSAGRISLKFHRALVEAIVRVAREAGEKNIVLTGGCFQNAFLTENAVRRLSAEGFRPFWHRSIPPNDGGISLGQAVIASYQAKEARSCV